MSDLIYVDVLRSTRCVLFPRDPLAANLLTSSTPLLSILQERPSSCPSHRQGFWVGVSFLATRTTFIMMMRWVSSVVRELVHRIYMPFVVQSFSFVCEICCSYLRVNTPSPPRTHEHTGGRQVSLFRPRPDILSEIAALRDAHHPRRTKTPSSQ